MINIDSVILFITFFMGYVVCFMLNKKSIIFLKHMDRHIFKKDNGLIVCKSCKKSLNQICIDENISIFGRDKK